MELTDGTRDLILLGAPDGIIIHVEDADPGTRSRA
jgi:hypothetical protein